MTLKRKFSNSKYNVKLSKSESSSGKILSEKFESVWYEVVANHLKLLEYNSQIVNIYPLEIKANQTWR